MSGAGPLASLVSTLTSTRLRSRDEFHGGLSLLPDLPSDSYLVTWTANFSPFTPAPGNPDYHVVWHGEFRC